MNLISAWKYQLSLFALLNVFVAFVIVLVAALMFIDYSRFSYAVPLLFYGLAMEIVASVFLYGLHARKAWAFAGGFMVIIAGLVLSLGWNSYFQKQILPSILFLSYSTLNVIALLNVLFVSAALISLCLAFSQQVGLRRILRE